jgi:hypothetical protein
MCQVKLAAVDLQIERFGFADPQLVSGIRSRG